MTSTLEDIKADSDYLRSVLSAELAEATDAFSDDAAQVLKFHGIYQQDDRDRRQGRDRDYVMMVRASIPGGVVSAEQYLVADGLADWIGNGTLRVTSRQGLQWHQVRKGSLRPLVWTLNQSLVTTFGACGDVVRNTVACPSPESDGLGLGVWATRIAEHFRPRTSAYYEVWIDGARTLSANAATTDVEPIYGQTYLPRKFKIGIAAPGDNCVDVFTHDIGLVAVAAADGSLAGFTVLAGGGQGRSHNQPDTFPRLADPLTTIPPGRLLEVLEGVVSIQRDHGNRTDRRHARLKYLIENWGFDRFRSELDRVVGTALPPAEPTGALSHVDHFGWRRQADDAWFYGLPIESGRIADSARGATRTALAAIAERIRPEFRFTAQQNLLLCGITHDDRVEVDAILRDNGVRSGIDLAPVVRNAMACVALPTCALALTGAERALPDVVADLAATLESLGLGSDEIVVRMTGCPNGCARPYSTEIGLVGHRKDRYDIHLGGARDGTRLNRLFAESVRSGEIVGRLSPVLASYASGRLVGETFGDYCERRLFAPVTLEVAP